MPEQEPRRRERLRVGELAREFRADKSCTVYVVDGADLERLRVGERSSGMEYYRQSPTAERMGRDYMAYRLEQVKSRILARYQQKGGIRVTDF